MFKNYLKNHKQVHRKANTIISVCLIFLGFNALAQTPAKIQKQVIAPNFIGSESFKTINRNTDVSKDSHGKAIVHLDGKAGPRETCKERPKGVISGERIGPTPGGSPLLSYLVKDHDRGK